MDRSQLVLHTIDLEKLGAVPFYLSCSTNPRGFSWTFGSTTRTSEGQVTLFRNN
jgi:hypothetical protein